MVMPMVKPPGMVTVKTGTFSTKPAFSSIPEILEPLHSKAILRK